MELNLNEIVAPGSTSAATIDVVQAGKTFSPQQQIILYSSNDWESFVHEWAHFGLKSVYLHVKRFTGAGDHGVDIAGFTDKKDFHGVWDNYQCKHIDHPLMPTDVWAEFGKVLWYSFNQVYQAPRAYFFVAPRGVGTKLNGLLSSAAEIKTAVMANWQKHIQDAITDTQSVELQGEFAKYVNAFDFSIFHSKSSLELIELYRSKCPFYVARFGGGLANRPAAPQPPIQIADAESRYVSYLLDAYADHTKVLIEDTKALKDWPKLREHFTRQREAFYHAEGLRVFARDNVPDGTFDALKEEIYDGVIDTHDAEHVDGYARVREVTKSARTLELTSNALLVRAKVKDRDGICHHLANEDWLKWTK